MNDYEEAHFFELEEKVEKLQKQNMLLQRSLSWCVDELDWWHDERRTSKELLATFRHLTKEYDSEQR